MSTFNLANLSSRTYDYIEIGTGNGSGIVHALRTGFHRIHSIEPTETQFDDAAQNIQTELHALQSKANVRLYRGLPALALKPALDSVSRICMVSIRSYPFTGNHNVLSRNGITHPVLDIIFALREFFHDVLCTPAIIIEHPDQIAAALPNTSTETFLEAVKSTIRSISPDYDFQIQADAESNPILVALPDWWVLGSRLPA